jgi:hypothetical protein
LREGRLREWETVGGTRGCDLNPTFLDAGA